MTKIKLDFIDEVETGLKKLEARVDERVAGFLVYGPFEGNRHIDLLVVNSSLRRQGIARAIITKFVSVFGNDDITLYVTPMSPEITSADLIRFYETFGFSLIEGNTMVRKGR